MSLTSDSINQFPLRSRQFTALLKPLDRFVNLALLQAELCESRDCNVTVWVDVECLLAECFGGDDVLLPLEDGERLVN